MATYEDLIAKSKELAAAGRMDEAKRVAEIALKTKASSSPAAQPPTGIPRQISSGLYEGIAGTVGQIVDIPQSIGNAALSGIDALTGSNLRANKQEFQDRAGPPMGSTQAYTDTLKSTGLVGGDPQTGPEKFARGASRDLGYAVIPGGAAARTAGVLPVAATEIAAALSGQGASQGAEALGASPGVQDIARIVGNVAGGVPTALATSRTRPPKAPATDDLYKQAGDLYTQGRATGKTATPQQTMSVVDEATDLLRKEGLVRPDGSIPKGYTKVQDALETLMTYGDNPMTPVQMQNVRQQISEAARAPGSEGRIGSIILKQFDDKMGPLVPEFDEANSLYSRAKRSDLIEGRVEKAERRAASSGTGGNEVNAIRQNLRGILDDDKLRRGFTDDQIKAMEAIVRGDNVTNNLRRIGKLSPTSGALPFMLSGGGVAASSGDPIVLALIGAAEGAKRGAESITQRQVKQLAEAVRRGAPVNTKGLNDAQKAIIASLLSSQTPTLTQEAQPPTAR